MDYSFLNAEQLQAVTTTKQYVRVVAGAGSGKTRVLTSRIIDLISSRQVPSYHIYAITFTNKAAQEMRERVLKDLPEAAVYISTFHSLALRIIREDCQVVNIIKDFIVVDDEDQIKIIKKVFDDRLPMKVEEIKKYIGKHKMDGLLPADIHPVGEYDTYMHDFYQKYQDFLQKNGYLDFDDLLIYACKVLKDETVRNKWYRRVHHLLIDEFQDTNAVQYDLMRLITSPATNIFIVGDADQTIYSWRGAKAELFLNFADNYPDAETIILDKNYRSTQLILDAANNLIKNNSHRIEKELKAVSGTGLTVGVKKYFDDEDEARQVIHTIKFKIPKEESTAILVRAAFLTRPLEAEFRKQGIQYNIIGAYRFYEREEIKDAFAYLRVVVNPHDDIALERIINKPKRGIGDTTMDKFRDISSKHSVSLYQAMKSNPDLVSGRTLTLINNFFDFINKVRENATQMSVHDILSAVIGVDYYPSLDDDRKANIDSLLESFEKSAKVGVSGVYELIQELSLFSAQDDLHGGEKVLISTIHAVKGLEFDNVFVVALCEGIFPNARSVEELFGLEEERRLAYVAITRARKRLFLSTNGKYNFTTGRRSEKSRFLDEIHNLKKDNLFNYEHKPYVAAASTPKSVQVSWNNGDNVFHEKFGNGVVVEKITDNLIAVEFDGHGRKILLATHQALRRQ